MAKTLRLVLGDQLNIKHSWFTAADESITYLMMEMQQETTYVTHHIQKIVAFFASMRNFARWLQTSGHQVHYFSLDDKKNKPTLAENIIAHIEQHGFERFEYLLPDEYRLDKQLLDLCEKLEVSTGAYDTEHFITGREDLAVFFGEKNYLMETFYRHIRKQNGWLMDSDKPEGGRWNYDKENRKALPREIKVIAPKEFNHNVSELAELIKNAGIKTIGSIDPDHFIWPLKRSECLDLLQFFLSNCFQDFGKYQDAMHSDYWSLFHARISFALNSKMLGPREVVDSAIDYYKRHDSISLAAVEGFIRQVIGWREFMRGVYWAKMPAYAKENRLNHHRPLPAFYWSGKTKMSCLKHAIDQSLQKAYAHHIQRLMVTGNFALLAGVHPDAVDEWYLGIYIDAIQWVEITNTRGMSQFADGGVIATKPYVSSANYINKMSNYCQSCFYNFKEKTENDPCPFNSLYWNFLIQHQEQFVTNHRMKMMYSRVNKMTHAEKQKIIKQAEKYLRDIDKL
ncbi:MAG: cryptochrome/photolyase family protein [Desulfobacterales bacterium]|nr:cryptochrome/photolyase family protein [Desulfobacterales bacterium]